MYPNKALPVFKWLNITGEFPKDDFWFSKNTMMLNVSEGVLTVIKQFQISNCDIEPTDKEKISSDDDSNNRWLPPNWNKN